MIGIPSDLSWAGLPGSGKRGTRSGQRSKTAAGGEAALSLVLDGEEGRVILRNSAIPPSNSISLFAAR
jgi:hypothetical protein